MKTLRDQIGIPSVLQPPPLGKQRTLVCDQAT
jgi:hypothetical protein